MDLIEKWFGFGIDERYDDGVRALRRQDLQGAIEAFRSCLARKPEGTIRRLAVQRLGQALNLAAEHECAHQAWGEAAEYLKEACSLQPGYADYRLALAEVERQRGRPEYERKALEQALAINPNYTLAAIRLAANRYAAGDRESALGLAHSCSGREGVDRLAYEAALERHAQGDFDAVPERLRSAASSSKADSGVLITQGDVFASRGDWRSAEEMYRQALAQTPNYPDVHYKRGVSLLELNQVEDAIDEFAQAIGINPGYAQAWAMEGVAMRRYGREEEAMRAFQKCLEIDPDHPIAVQESERRR